jgi:hypothetical protein
MNVNPCRNERRGGRVLACMLAGVSLALLPVPTRSHAWAADVNKQLYDSFKEWDAQWDEQTVQEFVQEITDVGSPVLNSLSESEVNEVAMGLRDLPNVKPVTALTHPLEKEVIRQSLRYWMGTYVTLGAGRPDQQQQLATQLAPVFENCQKDLTRQYPDYEDIISRALERARQQINYQIKNPLRRDFKKPVDESAMNGLKEYWMLQLERLPSELPKSGSDGMARACAEASLNVVFLRAFSSVGRASQIETLPKPPELIAAEAGLHMNLAAVDAWRREKLEESFRKQVREIRAKQATSDMPVDNGLLLAYLVNIGDSEATMADYDVKSEVTDSKDLRQERDRADVNAFAVDETNGYRYRESIVADSRSRKIEKVPVMMVGLGAVLFTALLLFYMAKKRHTTKGEAREEP